MLNLFKYLYRLLVFISDSVAWATGNKSHVLLSAGLGLGLGLGVVVALTPPVIKAGNNFVPSAASLSVTHLKSSDLGIDTEVKLAQETPNTWSMLNGSVSQLTEFNQQIVIQGQAGDYGLNNLSTARLGDELWLLGSNNGWYRFEIGQVRWLDETEIDQVISDSTAKLIIFSLSPVSAQATLVEAMPVR